MYTPDWALLIANTVAGEIVNSIDRGSVIKERRARMGLTQSEVGEIIGLRRETVSRVENGKIKPTLEFIRTFAGMAALIEAVKSYRSKGMAADPPILMRMGAELGVPHEFIGSIAERAIGRYELKRERAVSSLEE